MVKTNLPKQRQIIQDHYGGTRLGLVFAHTIQRQLIAEGAGPIGVGAVMRGEQISLSAGVALTVVGQQAGQALIQRHKSSSLAIIKGVEKSLITFRTLHKKASKIATPDTEETWTTVRRTSVITRRRIDQLVRATGATVPALRILANRIVNELRENGPMTMPDHDADGKSIVPGECTVGIEQWKPLDRDDLEDIRQRLFSLPPGKTLPLLVQVLAETGEVRVEHDANRREYLVSLPDPEGEDEQDDGLGAALDATMQASPGSSSETEDTEEHMALEPGEPGDHAQEEGPTPTSSSPPRSSRPPPRLGAKGP
jgi:hypothetical protein